MISSAYIGSSEKQTVFREQSLRKTVSNMCRFENWEISLQYSPVFAGGYQSRDTFKPIALEQKNLLDYRVHKFCRTSRHNIKLHKTCETTFPNTHKGAEHSMSSRAFLIAFRVFGNVERHCLECLIYIVSSQL